jgi:hypothetical protein
VEASGERRVTNTPSKCFRPRRVRAQALMLSIVSVTAATAMSAPRLDPTAFRFILGSAPYNEVAVQIRQTSVADVALLATSENTVTRRFLKAYLPEVQGIYTGSGGDNTLHPVVFSHLSLEAQKEEGLQRGRTRAWCDHSRALFA